MPRNGSGSYSLPEAPFVPLTTISSAAVNSDFSDIGTALTGSLARDGQGGMTAVLPLSPTGFTYTNDLNTGMYRTGSDVQAIKCAGTDVVEISSTGIDVTGDIQQNGISLFPIGLGPMPWSRIAAPSGWVFVGSLYSRTTYAALWAVAQAEIALGNTFYTNGDGSTTFGVGLNMPGCVPACNDAISGSAAGRLTSTTMTPNGSTIGATNPGVRQTVTVAQTNLPSVNFAVNGTVTVAANNGDAIGSLLYLGYKSDQAAGPGASAGLRSADGVSLVATHSLTAASGGSGTALNNVQPTIITNYIIFAGV